MPFEPLGTDEKIEGGRGRRPRDFEGQLMSGCAVILAGSLFGYLLAAWPYFVFDQHTLRGLGVTLVFSTVPVWVFGVFLVRTLGQAGATAFAGALLVGAIFMYLRLQLVVAVRGDPNLPQAEYPDRWHWMVPLGWLLAGLAVLVVFLPKDGGEDEAGALSGR